MSKFNYANEIYNINSQAPKALDMSAVEKIPEAIFGGFKAGQSIQKNLMANDLLTNEIDVKKHENSIRHQYLDNPIMNRQYEPYLGIKSSYMPTQTMRYKQVQVPSVSAQNQVPVAPLNQSSTQPASNLFQINSSFPTNNTINGIGYVSPNRTDAYNFPSVLDAGLSSTSNNIPMSTVPQNNFSLENMTINLSEPNRAYNSLLMGDTGELTPAQQYARLLNATHSTSQGSRLWDMM